MNIANKILLLLFNISQLNDKKRIVELFNEGMNEVFNPASFLFFENVRSESNNLFEIKTGTSSFGFIQIETVNRISEMDEILFENSVQMLAVILEKLEFYNQLQEERTSIQQIENSKFQELEETVNELTKVKTATLNLISDLNEEIIKRTEIENKLRESEANYRILIENQNDLIAKVDNEGILLFVSPTLCKFFGTNETELLGKNFKSFLHEDDLAATLEAINQLQFAPHNCQIIHRAMTPKGWRSLEWFYTALLDENNNIISIIGVGRDITEHRIAEEALRESENRFNLAMKASNDGLFDWNLETTEIYYSPAWKKMLGYADDELPNDFSVWENNTEKEDAKKSWELQQKLISKEIDRFVLEFKMKHKEGHWVDILSRAEAIFDDNGKAIRIVGTHTDISERKQTEEKIREKDLRFRKLSANMPDLIYQFTRKPDGSYCVPVASEGIKNIFGCSPEDVVDSFDAIARVIHPEDAERVINDIEYSAEHLTYFTCEFRVLIPGKPVQWIFSRSNPEKLSDGSITWYGFNANITERKKVEEALRESEERYAIVVNATEHGIWDWNIETDEVYFSKQWKNQIGYDDHEIKNEFSSWIEHLHPDEKEMCLNAVQSYLDNPFEHFKLEFRFRHKDGHYRWIYNRASSIKDKNGKVVRMYGAHSDITDRKNAEMIRLVQYNIANAVITSKNLHKLFESIKAELNNIIGVKNFFIAFYNKETGMLNSNVDKDEKDLIAEWPAEKSLTGYVIEQNRPILLRKNDIIRLHKEGIIDLIGTTAEAWLGVPLKIEGKVLGAIVVQNYENPDVYDQSSIEILELVAHELSIFIDRRREVEKATKLSRAVEQSSVSVMITNNRGYIEYVNPFFTKLTGYTIEEVIGKNPNLLKSGHQPKEFYEELWKTILSGKDWGGEILNKNKAGGLYWVNAVISPILNSEGVVTNFVAIKEDITERKKILKDLITAKEKAEEMSRVKSNFLANMSHELRTPLVAILGFSEFLKEELRNDKDLSMMVENISKGGNRLLETVNLILDISQIESGKKEILFNKMNIVPLLKESFELFNPLAISANLEYKFKNEKDEIYCCIDERLFRDIINNLLNNAIKFTDDGTILLSVDVVEDKVHIKVVDTGIGIPQEKQEVIWEEFRQASEGLSRSFEGTGLGLTLVKKYTELMKGSISLFSEVGKGSSFSVELPLVTEQVDLSSFNIPADVEPTIKEIEPTQKASKKILYVEDDKISIQFVSIILSAKYYLDVAPTAEEALKCINQNLYDVILMDINLSRGMDGVQLTELIRSTIPGYKDIPIIATTAYAMQSDKEEFLRRGMNEYISKPFAKKDLLALLERVLS